MKRLCSVVTLMLLTTAAHAGTVYSFDVGGRTLDINVSSGCTALECISVTRRATRDRAPRRVSANRSMAKTAARHQTPPSIQTAEARSPNSPQPPSRVEAPSSPQRAGISSSKAESASTRQQPPASDVTGALPTTTATGPSSAMTAPAVTVSLPRTATLADTTSSGPASAVAGSDAPVAASAPKPLRKTASSDPMPPARAYDAPDPAASDVTPPAWAYDVPATTTSAASLSSEMSSSDHERSTRLEGNWLAEDTSSVRIKPCGPYLCGYAAGTSSNQTEQEILIDMKPISSSEWVGMILNRETDITYPAIVILEGENALRVRSCGLSASFCGGQMWSREASVTADR
jgi:uncharacterized protein (DUF2147 family)